MGTHGEACYGMEGRERAEAGVGTLPGEHQEQAGSGNPSPGIQGRLFACLLVGRVSLGSPGGLQTCNNSPCLPSPGITGLGCAWLSRAATILSSCPRPLSTGSQALWSPSPSLLPYSHLWPRLNAEKLSLRQMELARLQPLPLPCVMHPGLGTALGLCTPILKPREVVGPEEGRT